MVLLSQNSTIVLRFFFSHKRQRGGGAVAQGLDGGDGFGFGCRSGRRAGQLRAEAAGQAKSSAGQGPALQEA